MSKEPLPSPTSSSDPKPSQDIAHDARRSATPSPQHAKPPRRIFITNLEILASVGVFEIEHRYEQRVIISLELNVDDTYDGKSERLSDVVDYSELARATEAITQSGHFKLIETLAERIAEMGLKDQRIRDIRVRIEKPDIMPRCSSVGIEITRHRI
ncbi:MAG: dihydroneopterin aldolase [Hyphomicrobiaceae bacterium]|nr:dihydroneopterin aldolase [Hyphomicrobiaceae bacterium]